MRLASSNLENISDPAKALKQDTTTEGKVILDEFTRANKLLPKKNYSGVDKKAILKGLNDLEVLRDDNAGESSLCARTVGSSSSGRHTGNRPAHRGRPRTSLGALACAPETPRRAHAGRRSDV
jgi:hypothetical protein